MLYSSTNMTCCWHGEHLAGYNLTAVDTALPSGRQEGAVTM